jgi:hypothetical protein
MKSVSLLIVLISLYCQTLAQKNDFKPDGLRQQLAMTHYSADSSAAAVIIFDNGSSHIASIGARALTYRRHVKIKIFRKEAFDEWANLVVFVERGGFSKLKGVTYNLVNDSIVKSEIDDNAIFKTRFNKYLDEIKFTLPNVREGSVIEYSYVIKGDGVPGWQFQYAIPVVQSEYTIEVPAVYKVRHTVTGLFSPAYETINGKEKWMLNNIPAFRSEPFMPSETDFVWSGFFLFVKQLERHQ